MAQLRQSRDRIGSQRGRQAELEGSLERSHRAGPSPEMIGFEASEGKRGEGCIRIRSVLAKNAFEGRDSIRRMTREPRDVRKREQIIDGGARGQKPNYKRNPHSIRPQPSPIANQQETTS